MAIRSLSTVDKVIDALGGTGATAKLMSRKPQHVSNWRAEKRIASETFLLFAEQLAERNLKAPPKLWGIKKPRHKKKPAA